jgi:CubicO group peptidase (beta-lactamase class C family)
MVLGLRVWKKEWLCPPILWVLAAAGATTVALGGLWYAYHWYVPKMGRLMTITTLTYEALLAVLILVGLKYRKRLPESWQTQKRKWIATTGYVTACMAILIGLFSLVTIPTPQKPTRFPSAAGSMWASAPDLAALMVELNDPQYLDVDIAAEMTSAQINVNPDISWGLGIGIQHSEDGDSLWHTGVHFDFNTLVVIYPETGNGVAIMTNTNADQAALRDIAQLALGGKASWEIPREVMQSSFMPEGGGE